MTERTEGWPAGLYLAALSFQAGAPSVAGAEGFAGDDRFVAEYFRVELLSRLPAAEAVFLKHTVGPGSHVWPALRRGAPDHGVGATRSRRSRAPMASSCRSTGSGEWYRYHHLFGELLRNELERSEPEVVPELNRRAMAWCIANDLTEAAVIYGHAAGETDTVAGLVDAPCPAALLRRPDADPARRG